MVTDEQARPLSVRQMEILEFIRDELRTRGYAPTVREIVRHVGDRSPTSVHRHLMTLQRRGYITRDAGKSRSIRLVRPQRGLPLAGLIAAGNPIEAVEQDERVDLDALFNRDDHFLLKVTGDSMIEDHIEDGDLVVVRQSKTCRNGDVVVAMLEGQNATLKRFFRERHRVRLQPANHRFKPIYTRDVEILGIVVGVIRQIT